ncbi:uncharacterized protein N7496_005790 [Penicillium cataractarum]|uniref:Zn(2)-C6 fungal-type domain-containing protein n=1 Tax=Penicillium cataractarum TaxID=2100454 RepID=A0A9W9V5I6_9EURO|nr:uncharacterized protein N7496_005790 [Penicillium cataractarum]KAJ5369698.1 hypothetical protein N7496_005790 [Penicillium cataractarum]
MTSSSRGNPTRPQDDSPGRQSSSSSTSTSQTSKPTAQPRPQPMRDGARGLTTAQPPAISRGICGRIAQWLWPGGWGPSCEPTGLGSVGSGTSSQQSASRPQLHIQPYASASLDCKACREWNVVCDHARPQCEHCYEQQILCFYVNPGQRARQKTRRRGENIAGQVAAIAEERARDAPTATTV